MFSIQASNDSRVLLLSTRLTTMYIIKDFTLEDSRALAPVSLMQMSESVMCRLSVSCRGLGGLELWTLQMDFSD